MCNTINILKRVILVLLAISFPGYLSARDFTYTYEGQTLTYTVLNEEAKTCETKAGASSSLGLVIGNNVSGELSIPEIAEDESGNKYTVTKIGKRSFWKCTELTGSLIIPESVTTIGDEAFQYCSGFTGDLIIGNSVITIGYSAFENCSFTGDLTIPNSVTKIGFYAFRNCRFTGDLTIGNSVVSIEGSTFSSSGFKGNLILGNCVTTIGQDAFGFCKFSSVTIPESLITIDTNAFYNSRASKVYITSLESWCNIDFKSNESNPAYLSELYLNGELIRDLVIPESITKIKNYTFDSFSGIRGNLTIPETVTEIGTDAFTSCGFTGSLTIPASVTTIGDDAFYNCDKLTGSLTIPNSVTKIGNSSFRYCFGFDRLILGESVKTLGYEPFDQCNFSEIISLNPIPPISSDYGNRVFDDSNYRAKLSVPNGSEQAYKESPVWSGFFNTEVVVSGISLNIEEAEIEEESTMQLIATVEPEDATDKKVTWSGSDETVATVDATGLVTAIKAGTATITATTSNGLTASCTVTVVPQTGTIDGIDYEIVIGGGEDGKDIVKVTGGKTDPDGTLRIPDEIEIDGKRYPVTEIGDGAFKNRTDISKLIIPAAVGTVGNEAFAGCTNLVEVEAEDSEKLLDCGTDAFKDAPIATLYLGRDTSGLPFTGKDSLTDLTFGDKVTSIGAGDFTGCGSIKNITVLATVPPTLHDNGFEQVVYKNVSLRVPDTSADDFRKADGWKNFFDVLGINEIRPIEITMELADVELTEGESTTLKAIITPENATDKSVTWSSSESSVASVDATGLVTALKAGTATITATTSNGLTVTCTVTVKAKSAGIDGVDSEGESAVRVEGGNIIAPEGCDVFDLSGRRVTATGLRTGIYIVRIPGGKAVKVRL